VLPLTSGEGDRLEVEGGEPLPLASGIRVRAPYLGGRFRVTDASGVVRLEGAAHFGDAAEADLRGASAGGSLEEAVAEADLVQSVEDPYREVWLCVAAIALVASWAAVGWDARRGKEVSHGV
jgi:hypothetical protein